MIRRYLTTLTILAWVCGLFVAAPHAFAQKATEGNEVVLNKLFPKKSKVQLEAGGGFVMNQSYLNSFLVNGKISYFWSEVWGLSLEGNFFLNSDKSERLCIENFYNDPEFDIPAECGPDVFGDADSSNADGDSPAQWGPAYVPIRELKYSFLANLVWNPIYGKQIILLSATTYFDLYVNMGGGLTMSDYYEKSPQLANGKQSRGKYNKDATRDENPGTRDEELVGISGRPVPLQQSNVTAHFAVGQRYHFLGAFSINAEMKSITLLGTESGFENYFVLTGGLGVRF